MEDLTKSQKAKIDAIKCAQKALKKHSRRSNAAKAVEAQIWNVVIAGGCWNLLLDRVAQLSKRYEGI